MRATFSAIAAGLSAVAVSAAPALAASPALTPHEAIYALRLSQASPSGGPRAAVGTLEMRLAQTCDGWDTKTHIIMNLAFSDEENVINERFFTSWESNTGRNYRFKTLTLKNGKTIEDYSGTAVINRRGGSATYQLPPPEGEKKARSVFIRLPADTLFPAAHVRTLLASAQDGKPMLRRVVLDGQSSVGPRVKSTAIGPRRPEIVPELPSDLDRSLLGKPSWPMSAAYFNMNRSRDLPNTEIFLQLFESGITDSFDQTFSDFTISARLERLRHVEPPVCP